METRIHNNLIADIQLATVIARPSSAPKPAAPALAPDTLHLSHVATPTAPLRSADTAAAATQDVAASIQADSVESLYDWSNMTPERLHELLN
ncbi:MAG: hypothetical protein EXS28_06855 [Pedosphaera sp.]|nr:hypothetical protein [Pedosphaera sp.]